MHNFVRLKADILIIDLRYATQSNILRKTISRQTEAVLAEDAAKALYRAAKELKKRDLRLVIWDALRTAETQDMLRRFMPDERYVLKKSKHLEGRAVDVTLADRNGTNLDMGSDFDDFSEMSFSDYNKLTTDQKTNRESLKRVMEDAGFKQWPYEWWHFDYEADKG